MSGRLDSNQRPPEPHLRRQVANPWHSSPYTFNNTQETQDFNGFAKGLLRSLMRSGWRGRHRLPALLGGSRLPRTAPQRALTPRPSLPHRKPALVRTALGSVPCGPRSAQSQSSHSSTRIASPGCRFVQSQSGAGTEMEEAIVRPDGHPGASGVLLAPYDHQCRQGRHRQRIRPWRNKHGPPRRRVVVVSRS